MPPSYNVDAHQSHSLGAVTAGLMHSSHVSYEAHGEPAGGVGAGVGSGVGAMVTGTGVGAMVGGGVGNGVGDGCEWRRRRF